MDSRTTQQCNLSLCVYSVYWLRPAVFIGQKMQLTGWQKACVMQHARRHILGSNEWQYIVHSYIVWRNVWIKENTGHAKFANHGFSQAINRRINWNRLYGIGQKFIVFKYNKGTGSSWLSISALFGLVSRKLQYNYIRRICLNLQNWRIHFSIPK